MDLDADLDRRPVPAFAHASEAELARILDFYTVAWEYEPRTFPILFDRSGAVRESFSPDFYLPELDLYLELTTLKQRLVRKKIASCGASASSTPAFESSFCTPATSGPCSSSTGSSPSRTHSLALTARRRLPGYAPPAPAREHGRLRRTRCPHRQVPSGLATPDPPGRPCVTRRGIRMAAVGARAGRAPKPARVPPRAW